MRRCYDCRIEIKKEQFRCDECDRENQEYISRIENTDSARSGNGIHFSEKGSFVTEQVINDRKKYAKDIIQPYRKDTDRVSREFVEAYPKQSQKMFTKEQIRQSKYLWK